MEIKKNKIYASGPSLELGRFKTIEDLREELAKPEYKNEHIIDPWYSEDESGFSTHVYREETDEEYLKRCEEHNKRIAQQEQYEYENFLKLKEKYEKKD